MNQGQPTHTSGDPNYTLSDITAGKTLAGASISSEVNNALKKRQEQSKKDVQEFAEKLTKEFKYVKAVGLLATQANKRIEEEYEIPEKETKEGLTHLLIVIPEKKFKDITNIRLEMIKLARTINKKFWLHVQTPVDIWNLGLDSKFDVMEAFAMSYPLYDKGLLGALRVTQIHKSLVLRKFEKYVTSYVIAGSLVREEETKTSDVDVFIVIDDTDVKRMPRLELKEKLKGIIYSYIQEAEAIAGVKNKLSPQIYLLTDFWEAVKDAHPVMFTFIRDGIPLYDRGAFLPWKSLLRMGKIRPSPEALDMFMSAGDKMESIVDKRIFDIAVLDIFYGIFTPTQGLLMLYGQAPKNHRETVKAFKETFVEKEKMIEKKYADILEELTIKYFKGYEHGKIKPGDINGTKLDELKQNALDYIKRLKELRHQIEKRNNQKSIEETYNELQNTLETILQKKGELQIKKAFEKEFIQTGFFPKRYLSYLQFISELKKKIEKQKTNKNNKSTENKTDVDIAKRYATEIMNALSDYTQRTELGLLDKSRYILKTKRKTAEIFFLEKTYVVEGTNIQTIQGKETQKTTLEELKKAIIQHKGKEIVIDFSALETLKTMFGEFDLTQ